MGWKCHAPAAERGPGPLEPPGVNRIRDLLYLVVAVVGSPVLAWRLGRSGKWRTDWAARFGRAPALPKGPRTLLLHGVSLGEINATRSLVAALEEADPELRIVISATTDSGFARARSLYGDRHPVVRFPFDATPAVRRFLDAVAPDAVALMELELWPTFTWECRRRGIPVAVVNGRLSAGSFRGYRRIRPLVRRMFQDVALAAVQTREYGERFAELGTPADRIQVVENLKWEAASLESPELWEGAEQLARALGIDPRRPLVVAGSTAAGEEALVLEGLPDEVQLLLAPRRPERFDEVAAAFPGAVRRTLHPDGTDRAPSPSTRVFLLDTLGELRNAYALADVVVVGRSFVGGMGGSDPIEAAALGKGVVTGPDHGNFADVVAAFLEEDAIVVAPHPGRAAAALLAEPERLHAMAERARTVVEGRQGVARRTVEALLPLL